MLTNEGYNLPWRHIISCERHEDATSEFLLSTPGFRIWSEADPDPN